jgi:HSP20 family protein
LKNTFDVARRVLLILFQAPSTANNAGTKSTGGSVHGFLIWCPRHFMTGIEPMLPTLRYASPFFSPASMNRLDSLFDRLVNGDDDGPRPGVDSTPVPISLWQDDNSIVLEAEVPGVLEKDVEITVHQGVLTIKAEKRDQEGRNYLHMNRRFGKFEHAITLPDQVDSEKVDASLADGVLRVVLPKVAQALPRKIALKSS